MRDYTFQVETTDSGMVRLWFGDGAVGSPVGWRDFTSKAEYKAWAQKDGEGRYPRVR